MSCSFLIPYQEDIKVHVNDFFIVFVAIEETCCLLYKPMESGTEYTCGCTLSVAMSID